MDLHNITTITSNDDINMILRNEILSSIFFYLKELILSHTEQNLKIGFTNMNL